MTFTGSASLRHGRLHVVQHAAELSADVLLAVDAFSDVGGSLERSIRCAAGMARAYLRAQDSVGLLVLDGALRRLPLDSGQRTFYRFVDAVLDVRRDVAWLPTPCTDCRIARWHRPPSSSFSARFSTSAPWPPWRSSPRVVRRSHWLTS